MRWKAGDIEVAPQAKPLAHARQRRVGFPAGEVARRIGVLPARAANGHAHGVPHEAARHFVVSDDGRKNRQSGGVGRRPSLGPQPVRREIEGGRL